MSVSVHRTILVAARTREEVPGIVERELPGVIEDDDLRVVAVPDALVQERLCLGIGVRPADEAGFGVYECTVVFGTKEV